MWESRVVGLNIKVQLVLKQTIVALFGEATIIPYETLLLLLTFTITIQDIFSLLL